MTAMTRTDTKLALKRLLSYVPSPNWADRYPASNRLENARISTLCRILLKDTGNMVFAGPFSTMRLSEDLNLAWDPKIIVGSYEEEVHQAINDVICMAPAEIIDIGASLGYYAVGLAMKIANTKVTAFEAVETPNWQQLSRLATINGVNKKIVQRGLCTTTELAKMCAPKSFILCDCEGGEMDILDPVEVPALKSCPMLVELHEFLRHNLVATLVSRFRDSHEITLIDGTCRNPSRYSILRKLPPAWRSVAIQETRWIPDDSSQTATWLRFMLLNPR